jgi:autophagy-related protein 27
MAPSDDDTKKPDNSKPDNEGGESVGSSVGWFFLMQVTFCLLPNGTDLYCRLIIVLVAYFGVGMYYNYSTYGATGADLIP